MNFDILFIDEREKGEDRLRQCQMVMLRMLKIVDYLCAKYNIQYFLSGGTLLGAIRHKGFIPWDDDLDIAMTRENYEKFVQYAVPDLPTDIFFQTAETDVHYPQFSNVDARLRDKYSSYSHIGNKNNKWHEGLQVDIFVLDRSFLSHKFFIILQNNLIRRLTNRSKRVKVLKWISKYAPFSLVYSSNFLQNFSQVWSRPNYKKAEEISCLVKAQFEDIEVYIPFGWNACLKRQYGDYMQLPPLEERKSHHKVIGDPFIPCDHKESLHWKDREQLQSSV